MKIAIDISQMAYEGHGVARYTKELVQALLLRRDHEYVLFAGALRQLAWFKQLATTQPWSLAAWRFAPLPPRLARLVFNLTSLPIEIFTGQVDIFHSSDWTAPATRGVSVTTIHDLAFRHYPETVTPLVQSTQERRLKRIVESGTHIIADSQSTKTDLMKLYQLPSGRIDVIYPGIDAHFSPQTTTESARVKKKYNLPKQYLLTLGTKEPRKNLRRLVEASFGLGLPLVVAGRAGWGGELPQNLRVIETGYVNDQDLPGLYSGAAVFVYPSLYEGFGFPVAEAMACGAPSVTSNTSSLLEVAGPAGVLIDPLSTASIASGIKQALSRSAELKQLGLKQAAQFTWSQTATQVVKVYERVYAHHR